MSRIWLLLLLTNIVSATSLLKPSLKFFQNWHCLGIVDKIDFSKPYKINVGDLPLVVWKNPHTQKMSTVINICRHMGSKLDNGVITQGGCLKCQYHGLEMSDSDQFGETMEFQGKVFWAYKPERSVPYKIPFYDNPSYETSCLSIDMGAGLIDSSLNMMDIRHPEYVHKLGFGSSNQPTNIRHFTYKDHKSKLWMDRIGLSFDYSSNMVMRKINNNNNDKATTHNFHMFVYPTFSWSRVSMDDNKHLIIGVNLLPLGPQKTRWFITVCHNYHVSTLNKKMVQMMAYTILSQDYTQMYNQHPDDHLRRAMMLDHTFPDEDVIMWMRNKFEQYQYPTMDICAELYQDSKKI